VPRIELPCVTMHEETAILSRKCSKYRYFRSLGTVAGFFTLSCLTFGHQLAKAFLICWSILLYYLVITTREKIWLEK